MNKIEIRRDLLISMQRALWGMIYPSVRSIAVGFEGLEKLKIIFYLDREPNDNDYEIISEVAGEVCADINFLKVEEVCLFSNESFSTLDSLETWVYMRKE
jgi:hypothetical protein